MRQCLSGIGYNNVHMQERSGACGSHYYHRLPESHVHLYDDNTKTIFQYSMFTAVKLFLHQIFAEMRH